MISIMQLRSTGSFSLAICRGEIRSGCSIIQRDTVTPFQANTDHPSR
jgi:hypothetical protein